MFNSITIVALAGNTNIDEIKVLQIHDEAYIYRSFYNYSPKKANVL